MSSKFGGFASTLVYLNLSSSFFGGRVPLEVSRLSKLVSLDLSSEYYQPPVLDKVTFGRLVGSLTKLRHLTLDGIDMSSINTSHALMNLSSSLRSLSLSDCDLRGKFPSEILHLSKLVSLDLSWNFDEPIDKVTFDRLGRNLTELRQLSLSGINMSSITPHALMNLSSSLRSLRLKNCDLRGDIPENIFKRPNLKLLDLGGNQNLNVPKLNHSSNLEVLGLSDMSISTEVLDSVCSLQSLKHLYLIQASFPGGRGFPLSIMNLSSLELLYADGAQFSRGVSVLPVSIGNLVSLQYLSLSNCSLTGSIPTSLGNLSQLSVLELSVNQFGGKIPSSLANLRQLKYLNLGDNQLEGRIPDEDSLRYLNLAHNSLIKVEQLPWTVLDSLDLSCNAIHGHLPIPPHGTTAFLISNNSLSGEIASLICNVTSLQILDLSSNNLIGVLPHCLGNFSNSLSTLNLGMNKLHGIIPPIYAKDCQLSYLNLNGNHFEGPLPRSIRNCRELEVLDVGNNKIKVSKGCSNNEPPPSNLSGGNDGSNSNITFGWKVVVIGYGCGLVFGLIAGYVVFQTGKPKWFVTLVEDQQHGRQKNPKIGNRSGGRRI
ncbi:hypothetical protein COLO4_23002 [Corchorus olitorius]|uniref:Disease resistance R13L4/SHOC-2-like LRR domain-containing protein n=1 Tax=Corchorus olitorius TaxID=93759 RepID=A0A1R3IIN4_9ROSI|nr:hypothetical protein COLO4_23002 [Corchorus olitorius]